MKRLIIVILLCLISTGVWAESKQEPKVNINVEMGDILIKKSNIPILMYHEIGNIDNHPDKYKLNGLYVKPEMFSKQLDTMRMMGYTTITMEQLYQHWVNNEPLPDKPIVITFDDGYESHYNFAAVELEKRGMVGTFYIITKKLHEGSTTPPEMLRQMHKRGMEIGSHTVNHIDSRKNTDDVVYSEYKQSKETLEHILGIEIRHFAYPYGGHTEYAEQTLKDLGYITSPRVRQGFANYSQGLFNLNRVRITYDDNLIDFTMKIRSNNVK